MIDLIDRKALLKNLWDWRLQECPVGVCDEETETYKVICECIEAVREQPRIEQPQADKWIPCSERLPSEKSNPITMDYYTYPVIVELGNKLKDVRYYSFGKGHWWYGLTKMDGLVTHWFDIYEIPQPYKKADHLGEVNGMVEGGCRVVSKFQGCHKCRHTSKSSTDEPCLYCTHNRNKDYYEPMTNADRIRNMTDEELAVYTCEIQQLAIDRNKADRVEDALKWLQAEAKEGAE